MIAVIVAAAGQGRRLGSGGPKALRLLAGLPLYEYTLDTLQRVPHVGGVWLVVPDAAREEVATALRRRGKFALPIHVVPGGEERQDSVNNAVASLPQEVSLVVVHDAARPFASAKLFESCIAAAQLTGAAIAAIPARDTVKLVEGGVVTGTVDRNRTWLAQTPQAARADWLRHALREAALAKRQFTDEAGALEQCGYQVHVVQGEEWNRKLTTPEDWDWAEWYVAHKRATSA